MMPFVEPPTIKDVGDLDETRRLLYVLLAHIYDDKIPSPELRGTLFNSLVHHHGLQTKPEMSKLFNDIRAIIEARTGSPSLTEAHNIQAVIERVKDTVQALTNTLTERIEGHE